jgi:hypothetical protein
MLLKPTLRSGLAALTAALLVSTVAAGQQAPPAAAPGGAQVPPGRAQGPPQPPAPSPAAVERASQLIAETRKAMGGDKLASLTSILVTGRTRRVRGDNLVPIEFEIAIEMPDKYVRKDEVPAEESDPTSTGFAAAEIIQFPVPPAGRPGGPGGPPAAAPPGGRPGAPAPTPEQLAAQRAARLNTAKQDFARLMLGLVPGSLDTFPMTFAYAAQAQAPQGNADVIDVRGPGNFTARLFVHSETHLPIMLSWQAPPSGVVLTTPGQPPPRTVAPGAVIVSAPAPPAATAPQEEKDRYAKEVAGLRQKAQTTPVEHRLYYADYRDADGVKLPTRLRRAIGADTTEETTFDRFRLNTKIDPRKFATTR